MRRKLKEGKNMQVNVQTTSKSYPVFIGEEALVQLSEFVQTSDYTKILIITDEIVAKHHLKELKAILPATIQNFVLEVPFGENAKQFSVYESTLTFALENRLDRKSCIIAFGGGAVGDLAGFVAATFMRGISFLQVPTTILAHDSAVGGKTGINHPLGKNLVGAFHQPDAVFYYTDFLRTLPISEIRSGFAEVAKHALIADPKLLQYLQKNITNLESIPKESLDYILKRGIEIKASVVAKDERESGIRAILNFGHTLGHTIEASLGYGKVTHGEAVMTGMLYALNLSKESVGLSDDITLFEKWVKDLGYFFEIPNSFDFNEALLTMKRDKKSVGNHLRFVLLQQFGKPVIETLNEDLLKQVYNKFISSTRLPRRS
ncbi:3-dehydroquinate synthase [Bacillus niameyensis]|uniref:3-dehydroquinate synthase n=1 Tax=Bacillus niameyensis TaxID=1522308 RepID=UPI0038991FB5